MLKQASRDLGATQLLVSHLCHELVSPIGAINNGVELIEETLGNGIEKDAFSLIGESGRLAAIRLRVFRLAYGLGGMASDFRLSEARQLLVEHFEHDSRTVLDWPTLSSDVEFAPGGTQLILNLVLQAGSCLPRGGTINVAVTLRTAGTMTATIQAAGVGARLPPGVAEALAGNADQLDHQSVHAFFCWQLLDRLGRGLRVSNRADVIEFAVELSVAATI